MIYDFSEFDFLVFFVFDFQGLYDFFWVVLFCVLDEEDVRSKFMCFLFLILFFLIDQSKFKILNWHRSEVAFIIIILLFYADLTFIK